MLGYRLQSEYNGVPWNVAKCAKVLSHACILSQPVCMPVCTVGSQLASDEVSDQYDALLRPTLVLAHNANKVARWNSESVRVRCAGALPPRSQNDRSLATSSAVVYTKRKRQEWRSPFLIKFHANRNETFFFTKIIILIRKKSNITMFLQTWREVNSLHLNPPRIIYAWKVRKSKRAIVKCWDIFIHTFRRFIICVSGMHTISQMRSREFPAFIGCFCINRV